MLRYRLACFVPHLHRHREGDLTLASDLTFVFTASWVRPERCVDPSRPPHLSGTFELLAGYA